MDNKENQTNHSCYYYNWGGDLEKGYPSYPLAYGARCEFEKEFFERDRDGHLTPNCYECTNKLTEISKWTDEPL